jgi:hypothetical protein
VAVAAVGQGRRGKQAHTHHRCERQGERSQIHVRPFSFVCLFFETPVLAFALRGLNGA